MPSYRESGGPADAGVTRYKPMAPWQEITYFNAPVETVVNIGGLALGAKVVSANPRRVVLVMVLNPGTATFSTSPSPVAGQGIVLAPGGDDAIWTEATYGPLCTSAWYLSTVAAGVLTVIEVILREFPN